MRGAAGLAVALACALACALAACVEPDLVHCADGTVCPEGSVCGPFGCAVPDRCGDGTIDSGEACDDHNRVGNDGCSADCMSDESCANGYTDSSLGEQCDDGNAISHDGCSSGCVREGPVWRSQEQGPGDHPGPLHSSAAAWDADRGDAIILGGVAATNPVAEVWRWRKRGWERLPERLPAVFGAALAGDGRGGLLAFGGRDKAGAMYSDCTIWDGASWSACAGSVPSARAYAGLTDDGAGGALLYGGFISVTTPTADMWRWDGSGWQKINAPGPTAPIEPRLVRDAVRGVEVLTSDGETWTWDGAAFTPGIGIDSVAGHASVYDPLRRRVVVIGGDDGGPELSAAEWDGSSWTELDAAEAPGSRTHMAAFYDPDARAIVVFGGIASGVVTGNVMMLRWESDPPTADEECDGITDLDRDGLIGCADPDCWFVCSPRCPPGAICDPGDPRCGDGVCNPALETAALCPTDGC